MEGWGWGEEAYKVIEDFVAQDTNHLKRLSRGDGVDEHVAMDADEMLGIQDAVFVLERDGRVRRSMAGCSRPQQAVLGCGTSTPG